MKKKLEGINVLYPTPTVLVGAMVDGKPNYITIAHIGIVSHARPYQTDKSDLFEIFYGELQNAPMIKECPLNMECRLYDTYDTPTHDLFIGEIVETYADESVLTEGKVDLAKLKPLLFDMSSVKYWSVGEAIAGCWNIGKKLKRKP